MTTIRPLEFRAEDVTLIDILDAIDPVQERRWAVLELYATGTDDIAFDLPALEQEISSSASGKLYSDTELRELAQSLSQTIDASIVCMDQRVSDTTPNWEMLHRQYSITIEAVDNTFWRVSAHDPQLLQWVRDRLKDALM